MDEWPIKRIGEMAESVSVTHSLRKENLIFLNTSDILHGEFLHNSYTSVSGWPGQAKKSICKHDILFSEIRPANGRWAYVDFDSEDYVVSTKLMVIRADANQILPRYLYHFLTWNRTAEWLQHLAESRSGTFPQITFDEIAILELAVLPISMQAEICQFLGSITRKIELNRQINETLEALARALFKDWFVDFGPTRTKAEGGAPYLAPELWALFPDALDDEDKPVGWVSAKLEEAVELNPRETLKKGAAAPYLDMAALPTAGALPESPIARSFTSGSRFRNGDTLLARITPCLENGKTAYVQCLSDDDVGWGSTEFIVLRSKPPIPKAWTYLLGRNSSFRDYAIQSMTGTSGRQRARTEALAEYLVVTPDEPVWLALSDLLTPIFEQIKASGEESRTLAQTRDLLLPKLMSGEIRLREAERAVDAVL